MAPFLAALVGAALLLASSGSASAQTLPSFSGLGDLAGGDFESSASSVSADASTVVGFSISTQGMQAFRWTSGGGLQGLGFLSGSNPDSEATGVSSNGSVIVGTSKNNDGDRGFRWTSGGGMQQLGTFSCSSCDPASGANGVSGNGLVAVGAGLSKSLFGDPELDAARWASGGTSISDLGDLPGPGDLAFAHGASLTGTLIVGEGNSSAGSQGWRWSSGSMVALVGVPGAQIRSGAMAVSSDASTIVGFANTSAVSTGSLEAVRWTGASFATITQLGALPGASATSSNALAVSGNGSVIVGRGRNSQAADRAFIWTAADGMRELSVVLEEEYGLDLSGWTLQQARGVSDANVDGVFTVVGDGINPNGDPEGWRAVLARPACSNGDDDDLDLATDFPADLECTSEVDLSEVEDCSDGIDNDGDGDTDAAADAGCTSPSDQTEQPDCQDGYDNDGDGDADHPQDAGCQTPEQDIEDPACDDGDDNDFDLATDFPSDTDCVAAFDRSEVPDCNDGLDNDLDLATDFPADSDCAGLGDQSEAPECSDGIDNDGDGRLDHPAAYPACESALDPLEEPQCGDGVDNDGDTDVDHPADTGCASAAGLSESPPDLAVGDLLVVDRAGRVVFSVDPATGAQALVSREAWLTAPQGIATNASGNPVVADPAGLVELDPLSGAQRLASGPLSSGSSLQLVFPTSGDPFVLESSGVSQVLWSPSGIGAKSTFFAVPSGEPIPILGLLAGDSLALDDDGNLVTGGFGLFGDGVFRIDVSSAAVTLLKPGFTNDIWLDLAVEDADTLLGVGQAVSGGVGLHRIDAATGIATPLSTGAPFVAPVAVVRDANGEIYVADAGTCAPACSGGAILHVDPTSGSASVLATGGFIEGEMDLAIAAPVPEPGVIPSLVSGTILLLALARRRSRW